MLFVGVSDSIIFYSIMLTQPSTFIRPHQEESYSELYRPCMKTARDPSEEHTTRQGPHGQSFQGSQVQTSKRPHSLVFQEENQDFNIPHIQSAAGHGAPSSEEWIPVQSRGDRRRSSIEELLLVTESSPSLICQTSLGQHSS